MNLRQPTNLFFLVVTFFPTLIRGQGGGCNVCEQKTALRRSRGEAEPQCQFETAGFSAQTSDRPFELSVVKALGGGLDLELKGVRPGAEFTDFLIYFHAQGNKEPQFSQLPNIFYSNFSFSIGPLYFSCYWFSFGN